MSKAKKLRVAAKEILLKDVREGEAFIQFNPDGKIQWDCYVIVKGRTWLHNHPYVEVMQAKEDWGQLVLNKFKIFDLDRKVIVMRGVDE